RPTGGFQVTRRRSGTRSARISWTRYSAERRSPRDAPTVGGWESCGRRGRGGSGDHCPNQLPAEIVRRARPRRIIGVHRRCRAELGIHGLYRWTVKCLEMSRKRGVQTDRNGPSPPSFVAKAEMSTADRLGSREVVTRSCGCTCYDWSYDQDATQSLSALYPPGIDRSAGSMACWPGRRAWGYNRVWRHPMRTITIEVPDHLPPEIAASTENLASAFRLAAAIFWYDR